MPLTNLQRRPDGHRVTREDGPVHRSSSSEGGFTIVEVLIAMVILTVALVALAELMAITLRMQMLGRNETAAVRLIQEKVDELVNLNFFAPSINPLVNVGGSLTADTTTGGVAYFDTPVDGFKRRWQIDAISGETEVRKLTVRIIPTIADRRTNADIELSTFIRSNNRP